ncbi:MAG: ribosomal protein L7/L12 [Candidatus Shikimatogenerans sp. AspAUS03]|uniref:Ribosomal protein L7/L12 n=1 Tax=Candidatus Shikimatogenerans sp. AspAUS03 TaxID=3158563 RepID=A0AAU7QS80_9FLAO
MSKNIKKIAKIILKLNIIEINKLLNIFDKKYNLNLNNNINNNITANSNINSSNSSNNSKNDKVNYTLIIKSFGNSKLSSIKLIKEITNLTLTESKRLLDNLPSVIKKDLSKEEAKILEKKFNKIGIETELK